VIGDGLSQSNKSIEIRLLPKKFKETVTNLVFSGKHCLWRGAKTVAIRTVHRLSLEKILASKLLKRPSVLHAQLRYSSYITIVFCN